MDSDLKRKLAAILVADIVGYSRLIASDEEATLRRLEVFRAMWQDCAGRYGGRIFNTAGDAVLAEFPSAVEAVRCATDFQAQAAKHNQSLVPDRQMHFRVGITIGDVVQRGGDLLGDGVNIAARLQGLAEKGGICVSSWVRESVANKLSIKFADLGEQTVKNIPEPIRAYAIVSPGSSTALTGAATRQRSAHGGFFSGRVMIVAAVAIAAVGVIVAFMFAAQLSSTTKTAIATKPQQPSSTPPAAPASEQRREPRTGDDSTRPPKSSDIGELFKKARKDTPPTATPPPPVRPTPQRQEQPAPSHPPQSARPTGPAVPPEAETTTSGDEPPPPVKTVRREDREDELPPRKADEKRIGDAAPLPPVVPPSVRPDTSADPEPSPAFAPTGPKFEPLSETAERDLRAGQSFKECPACPSMVAIPTGSFMMGAPSTELGHANDEGPIHRVSIRHRVAISHHPITVAQFDTFVTVSGYRPGESCRVFEAGGWIEKSGWSYRNPGFPQDGEHPAVCINWNDAVAYTNWLTARTGKPYRLPSEAEWEYAARAGTTTAFWWGNSIGPDDANYDWNLAYGQGRRVKMLHGTMPVRSFRPNPWQLYQVHGNVSEWVEDCWNVTYERAPTDGSAWLSGNCSRRLLRGGSWGYDPKEIRSAYREGVTQGYRNFNFGFRVARTLGATN